MKTGQRESAVETDCDGGRSTSGRTEKRKISVGKPQFADPRI